MLFTGPVSVIVVQLGFLREMPVVLACMALLPCSSFSQAPVIPTLHGGQLLGGRERHILGLTNQSTLSPWPRDWFRIGHVIQVGPRGDC